MDDSYWLRHINPGCIVGSPPIWRQKQLDLILKADKVKTWFFPADWCDYVSFQSTYYVNLSCMAWTN